MCCVKCALIWRRTVFLLSVCLTPSCCERLPRLAEPEVEDTFLHPLSGEPVQVSSGWKKTSDRLVITWHYDHLLPDGRVERLTSQVRHRLDSVQDYLQAFSAAGLQVERLYGDFDCSAYTAGLGEPDYPGAACCFLINILHNSIAASDKRPVLFGQQTEQRVSWKY